MSDKEDIQPNLNMNKSREAGEHAVSSVTLQQDRDKKEYNNKDTSREKGKAKALNYPEFGETSEEFVDSPTSAHVLCFFCSLFCFPMSLLVLI